jgi:small conductance mechanosensitive channel
MMQVQPETTPQDTTVDQVLRGVNWQETIQLDQLLPRLLQIAIVVVVAVIFYRVARAFITRVVNREIEEDDPLVRRLREQRARTLGSLLGSVLLVTLFVIVALTTLDILLGNIGPILASFGIIGLAFSFGAQSLVKDVISGTFMLLEGQFGIGDVVRIEGVAGMVEKITLRTTVLRDLEGVVHIIPNGSITRVSNLTKAWSRAVLDVGVAYREDLDRVLAALKDELDRFHRDIEWGGLLLEEPEVLGVQAFTDSAVVIRSVAKTLPLKQWDVARELRRRIKNRFDREGIEIPYPHLTFYWGDKQAPAAIPAPADADTPS